MTAILEQLGRKLHSWFGDDTPLSHDRDLSSVFGKDPLSSLLPYCAFDPDTGVFVNHNSIGFVVEALPIVGSEDSIQKEIYSIIQDVMTEGASLQCLLWADNRSSRFLDRWTGARKSTGGVYLDIAKRRQEHFSRSTEISPRIFRFILSFSIPAEELEVEAVATLQKAKNKIIATLSNFTYAYAWDAQDLIQALDGWVNFRLGSEYVERSWDAQQGISEQLPTGGRMLVGNNHIDIETEAKSKFRSYRTIDSPQQWSLGAMQNLIGDLFRDAFRINTPFFLQYGIHCPKQSTEESKLFKKMHLIENQGKSMFLRRLIPQLESELKECHSIRHQMKEQCRIVWTQLSAGVWAAPEMLEQVDQDIKSLFRINSFKLTENTCLHLPGMLSAMPMSWGEYAQDLKQLNLLKTTMASECANLIPLQGESMGTPSPGMLLIGRRGQLFNWNPFDNKGGNYNIVVVGRSGSGKSVFMQDLLMSSLGVGAMVFAIDVGRSYEKMCYAVSGQMIEFSKGADICLNPFTNIPTNDAEEREGAFSMLKAIIGSMAAPSEGTTDYENALIEQAISAAWGAEGNQATITNVSNWLQEQPDAKAKSLGVMLTPYCVGGMYARYFEGENNIDFSNSMVLIELEELKERKDLQSVVLQMCIMTITAKTFLGDRKRPFHLCVDEAWDLLRGKQTGVFIETLARRLRKYNGSLIIGTQSVDDFYTTPGALAAFDNSDWMCLLSQKKSSIQRLSESGKITLSDYQKRLLESVSTQHGKFSEVMICDGQGGYSLVRLVLDPFSQLLYTTKADEYHRIQTLRNSGLTVTQAIDQLLEDKRRV